MTALPADFPDWMPPMLVKELRQGMRAKLFLAPFVLIHAFAIGAVAVEFSAFGQSEFSGTHSAVSVVAQMAFGSLWFVASTVLLLVIPARGIIALQGEAGVNAELLFTARLTTWRIVVGKWLVLCAQAWLVLISLLPYLIVRYFMGGMNIGANMLAVAYLVAANATVTALCIGASGYANNLQRVILVFTGLGAITFTAVLPAASSLYALGSWGGSGLALWLPLLMGTYCFATFALYVLLGLQLGRGRLARSSPYPYEVSPSRQAVVLIIATPFILGMTAAMTVGLGAPVVVALLIVAAARMNPARRAPASSTALYPVARA
ncbi:hypothetical protein BH23VER1_BH23VER1_23080 [soil metagenome]